MTRCKRTAAVLALVAVGTTSGSQPAGAQVEPPVDLQFVVRDFNTHGLNANWGFNFEDRLDRAARAFAQDAPDQVGLVGLQEAAELEPACGLAPQCFRRSLAQAYDHVEARPDSMERGSVSLVWDDGVWESVGFDYQVRGRPQLAPYVAWKLESHRKNVVGGKRVDNYLLGVRLRHKTTGHVVRVFNTHFAPTARRRGIREKQTEQVARALDSVTFHSGELPPILVGDFNFCPPQHSQTCEYADVERRNYNLLARRFELADQAGPNTDSVIQVWLGKRAYFRATRGDYSIPPGGHRFVLRDPDITDHGIPSVRINVSGAPAETGPNWSFDADLNGTTDRELRFGQRSLADEPVVGDWNGDGRDGVGIFRKGLLLLDDDVDGRPERRIRYGDPADRVVVGDWDGDGRDGVALGRRPLAQSGWRWSLDNNLDGRAERSWRPRVPQLEPGQVLAGDWDGDGRDAIVVFRDGRWAFDNNLDGVPDRGLREGVAGDVPIAGDWDGDGRDGIAIFRRGEWHVDNDANGLSEFGFRYGSAGDVPLVADLDGDRRAGVGVFR